MMTPGKGRWAGLCASLILAVGAGAAAQRDSGQSDDPPPKSKDSAPKVDPAVDAAIKSLVAAEKKGDIEELMKALDKLWSADASKGKQAAMKLVERGTHLYRLLGVSTFAKHGDLETLTTVLSSLNPNSMRAERRIIVRAMGSKRHSKISEILASLARDNDVLVRSAAAAAAADAGSTRALAAFVNVMGSLPTKDTTQNEAYVFNMHAYGAARTLSGRHLKDQNEVRRFVEQASDAAANSNAANAPKRKGYGEPPGPSGRFVTKHFDVTFRFKGWQRAAQEGFQVEDWEQVARAIDEVYERVRSVTSPIFGTPHLPIIELVFADDQTIAAEGGTNRGYFGFAIGPKVVMRFSEWRLTRSVLAHELVHVVHTAHFERQPRWLSEGLAESLTNGDWGKRSQFKQFQGRHFDSEAKKKIDQGPVSAVVNEWVDSGQTGSDRHWYQISHLVIDYLRYAFPQSDIRMTALMTRLSRGESPHTILPQLWGKSLKELDQGLVKWMQEP